MSKGEMGTIAISRRQVLMRNPDAFENKFLADDIEQAGVNVGNKERSGKSAGVVAGTNSTAMPSASTAIALVYRPPPLQENASFDPGRPTGYYLQGGYGEGGQYSRQPPQGLDPRVRPEYQFRSLERLPTMSHQDGTAKGETEEGDADATAKIVQKEVTPSTTRNTTKADEQEEVEQATPMETGNETEVDSSMDAVASSNNTKKQGDGNEIDISHDETCEVNTSTDANVVGKITDRIELSQGNDIVGGSSSSIVTTKTHLSEASLISAVSEPTVSGMDSIPRIKVEGL